LRTFERLGLKAIPMRADTGPIGGDLSHEFVILADTGESSIAYDRDFRDLALGSNSFDPEGDLQPLVDQFTEKYAATDERRDAAAEVALGDAIVEGRGIEVGHIFYFGTKYSKAMRALVVGPDGEEVPAEMGSYGIGVSRLVGAIIEAYHDAAGIVWPESVAPFAVGLINLKADDPACISVCEQLYASLQQHGVDVLYDDRDERAGVKFSEMDLIGLPKQIVVGPRGAKNGMVELKQRRGGERRELAVETVLEQLVG
jgi:prolyl-tRNA synthetase